MTGRTDPPYLFSDSSTLSPTANPPIRTVRSGNTVNSPESKNLWCSTHRAMPFPTCAGPLPGVDGIELMESVPELADLPVIFLSAYGRDQVIARALEAGAEDYVVKPFSPTELVARVQTVLRRRAASELSEPPEPYRRGELTIDYAERRVSLADRAVRLTNIEYRLLFELSVNAGRVLTHEQLLQRVWGLERSGQPGAVRTFVKNLRRKLGDDADTPTYIFTEPRVGYRMPRGEGPEEAM